MTRCSVLWVQLLGIALSSTTSVTADSFLKVQSDPITSLRPILTKFNNTRNHKTNPEGKSKARDLIKTSFRDAGLHVWSETAKISESLSGENIVGMLRGKNTGTADDRIAIVGAHYDTTENTTGVDDNGSGVTAVLEAAKQIGKAGCQSSNTIMFVAFDFEEETHECNMSWPITCGSKQFVKNLTSYLKGTGGTVSGALVLETIINYNSTAGSQLLPGGMERALPGAAAEVKNDSYRGNFIAVVGRQEPDKQLLALIKKYYQKDADYRAQLMSIPLTVKPSQAMAFDDFYRSDHYQFWENDKSFSALMLTDTANFRGYMKSCYHHECDNLRLVKDDDLEFLRRTINAAIQTLLELGQVDRCRGPSDTSVTISLNLPLLILAMFSGFITFN